MYPGPESGDWAVCRKTEGRDGVTWGRGCVQHRQGRAPVCQGRVWVRLLSDNDRFNIFICFVKLLAWCLRRKLNWANCVDSSLGISKETLSWWCYQYSWLIKFYSTAKSTKFRLQKFKFQENWHLDTHKWLVIFRFHYSTPPSPSSVLWDPKFQWEAKDFYLSSWVHSKKSLNSCMDNVVLTLKKLCNISCIERYDTVF